MVIYAKYPILIREIRPFQTFLCKDMPDALLPDNLPEAIEMSLSTSTTPLYMCWPAASVPLFSLTGIFPIPGSDHRLVWVDVSVPQAHKK